MLGGPPAFGATTNEKPVLAPSTEPSGAAKATDQAGVVSFLQSGARAVRFSGDGTTNDTLDKNDILFDKNDRCCWGCIFRNCTFPEGRSKEFPKMGLSGGQNLS